MTEVFRDQIRSAAQEQVSEPESSEQALTPEKALKLFFNSFRFSQGSNKALEGMFLYLHLSNPSWRITPEIREHLRVRGPEVFEKFLVREEDKSLHKPFYPKELPLREIRDSIRSEILSELHLFEGSFSTEPTPHVPEGIGRNALAVLITKQLIEQDLRFLSLPGGRPRGAALAENPATTSQDPYLSHICYYALQGHSTGIPEYDMLFSDIRDVIQRSFGRTEAGQLNNDDTRVSLQLSSEHLEMLQRVAAIYNAHHLDERVTLNEPPPSRL